MIDFVKFVGYYYKCKSCGEIFVSERKGKFAKLIEVFEKTSKPPICKDPPDQTDWHENIGIIFEKEEPLKCPKCGSEKVREMPFYAVEKVAEVIKDIFKKNEKTNNEIRETKHYNREDNSVSQLQNLNSILNDIKESKKTSLKELENYFISNLEEIFNSIEIFIKENMNSEEFGIDTYSLRFNFDKLIKDFKNSFYDDINNKISLSDYKCLSILEIKASEKRLVEMNSYIDEIIKKSLDKYFDDLDFITNNTIEFIQRNIERIKKEQLIKIDMIKKEIEENANLNESEIEEKRKEYERKEKIIDSLLETINN